MHSFSATEQNRLHFLILGTGALVFIAYTVAFPGLQYFWDPSVKWFQILDLIDKGFADISCTYPAAAYDPDFRFIPVPYTAVIDGRCFYWFPFQLSYVLGPLHKLFGVWSVPIFQQGMTLVVLYGMVELAGRLDLSFLKTAAAIVLFRFGTANAAALHNLEDHTITQALTMGALIVGLCGGRGAWALAGGFIGLAFGFRQETIVLAPFVFASLWWMRTWTTLPEKSSPWILTAASFWIACFLCLGSQLALNAVFVGHPLGLRALHGPHLDFWNVTLHVRRAVAHFAVEWPWLPNGMLFQMPLLALVPFNLRRDQRTPSAVGLIVLSAALLPLLWISPGGGPHIGYRFAQPLVPILILLALRPVEWERLGLPRRALIVAVFVFSILIALGVSAFGTRVYKGYVDVQGELRTLPGDVIVLRDNETWAALGRLYRERPVMQVTREDDIPAAMRSLIAGGAHSVVLVKSTMVNSGSVAPAGLTVSERGRGRLVEWALVRFPQPTKTVASKRFSQGP